MPARRVAGTSAPGLRLVPASDLSSIDHADLWLDPASGVPLRVEVYAEGASTSAFTSQFREFSGERPDDEDVGFGQGRTPGGPSRWTTDRTMDWHRLRPELVREVTFDHLQGERFRHAATFRRWRPDKPPRDCTFDQIATTVPFLLEEIFAG